MCARLWGVALDIRKCEEVSELHHAGFSCLPERDWVGLDREDVIVVWERPLCFARDACCACGNCVEDTISLQGDACIDVVRRP